MSRAQDLILLFGGIRKMELETGIDKATIARWLLDKEVRRGTGGEVPGYHNHTILEAAERIGLDMEAVRACLNEHVCPTCGRTLEPGQKISAYTVRKA